MTVNRLVLEWEEKIKLHLEREMQFNQWRSKNFKGKHPTLIATKEGMDDEGEVTLGIDKKKLGTFLRNVSLDRFMEVDLHQFSHVSSPLLKVNQWSTLVLFLVFFSFYLF
ncbi:hypothetical protein Tco_0957220 [Tanacetum coccineum]